MMSTISHEPKALPPIRKLLALLAAPAVIVFLSSNFVNVGNLAFNMIFSRLMGPELFGVLAVLLTIKLAFLGVFGAVQAAVSQVVAGAGKSERHKLLSSFALANKTAFWGLAGVGFPVLAVGAMLFGSNWMGHGSQNLLIVLFAALPFGASLSLLRGVAFGEMNVARIVLTANVEMAVRLVGAIVCWQLGFGIEGVVFAISLSIMAGWLVLTDQLPRPSAFDATTASKIGGTLAIGALPFALLQVAQVAALDGDIFLARTLLSAEAAGYIAALSLFQRIQFFACFALASVLLPAVVAAARRGNGLSEAMRPVALLYVAVSMTLIIAAAVFPVEMLSLLAGSAYAGAADGLLMAVSAAAAFTFSYLVGTFLAARRAWSGIIVVFAVAVLQITLIATLAPETFTGILLIKLICQIACAVLVTIIAILNSGLIARGTRA